ncbi:MAG TPA: SPFH domain-containing protein [Candidatus Binatia bacterium]|nr:SPFH domain-containing protein [Candidatus Binatia bacterium]
MGLVEFVKKQFIDILEWTEADDETLVWRFPTADREIQQGAQLVVRETQAALFVDQGRVADLFGPGRHTIRTGNLPLLTDLRHWTKLFESPFKSEVYFFSLRLRLSQPWGTPAPVTIRDREFGAVRVRAFGTFSYRVATSRTFFERVSGTRESYGVGDLDEQLRSTLVSALADHVAGSAVPFLDMAAQQDELAAGVRAKATPAFADLGLALDGFQIQSISLPDELQQRLDERSGIGIVGDLGAYGRFQAGRSIPIAAAADGTAGAGVGLGVGIAMGQAMAGAVNGRAAGAGQLACPRCHATLERASRFCPECGASLG